MYFLSLLGVIITTALISFFTNGRWDRMFDVMSLLILLLLVIPILISSGLSKDFSNAFRYSIGKKKPEKLLELKRAKEAVSLVIWTTVSASVFVTMAQLIQILYWISELSSLGPNLSVMIISIMYGMGFVLLLLPMQAILNVKIQEFISGQE
ncbi:MAG: hypothetical protein K2P71_04810 [Lachnospiraceae bacterium]|jgi:hypothetical protein|nr:hypothetical protein [Lachnospiraceae bacterium]MDE6815338.1 hypothetical protein [Lachnospiraceae bacterium]